jgi:ribosomal protein S18 acetylase RimI-like enzyme
MIKIIDYDNSTLHRTAIKELNYEWLQKYFKVEPGDVISLSDPKEEIIDKGGFIFFAERDKEIIGVSCLLKITSEEFELGKMAVTEKYQGLHAGNLLLDFCIRFAIEKQIKKLILYSNKSLSPAIHLYKKYGFHEVEMEEGHYERANIKMERLL